MSSYKYKDLVKLSTQYANSMNYLSNRKLGEVARTTNDKSMKVVRMFSEEPVPEADYVVNWYPRHVETHLLLKNLRQLQLFCDEHQDFKEVSKGPPKKGEGKRSKK